MPPRSKQSKIEWFSCTACGCWLSLKDREKHAQQCSSGTTNFTHGFVRDRTLFGYVAQHSEGIAGVAVRAKEEVLAMNPSTMLKIGVCSGRCVVLNDTAVLLAWPDTSLPLAAASASQKVLDSTEIPTNKIVTVQPLEMPCQCAKKVRFQPSHDTGALDTVEFGHYLATCYDNTFLHPSEVLDVRYYGRPCTVTVTDIEGFWKRKPSDTHDSLISSLQTLSVQAKNTCDKPSFSFFKVTKEDTTFMLDDQDMPAKQSDIDKPTIADVGGLTSQVTTLREMISVRLKDQCSEFKNVRAPKAVLLYGPPGVGKTLLARALSNDANVPLITVNGENIRSKFYGETEANLESHFAEAKERAPCILLLENLDSLCPKIESSHNEVDRKVTVALLSQMDNMERSEARVLILGTTSRREHVDSALGRLGRFTQEMELAVPTASERSEILACILRKTEHSLTSEQIVSVAATAHGFVGADLKELCTQACYKTVKKVLNTGGKNIRVTYDDVLQTLKSVKPSAMREVALEIPQVTWEDIGGQEDLKHKLKQSIEWPLKHPDAFASMGIRQPKGLLMYGPPGCSKTMIAKALARESGLNFIAIKGSELFSKWVGESEKAVREVFRRARAAAPAIVFFDEIDALAGERGGSGGGAGDVSDRVLAQLLAEMDGVEALRDVFVLAATNRPDRIDKALLRPGRLDRIVYVPLPDAKTRAQIFNIHLKKLSTLNIDVENLVQRTNGYSGAEISAVCQEAGFRALHEDFHIKAIEARHFEFALSAVKPRTNRESVAFYEAYHEKGGLHAV